MMRPDVLKTVPSWEEKPPASGNAPLPLNHSNRLTEVANTLAAHGGGAVAFDLALDLVLNDVVEEARTVTGATGAAIALSRDGVMECRATTGDVAPGLGVRVESASGLSGACLQTREIQSCVDTQSDSRVDAEACRDMGVRSVIIVPVSDGREAFGILEVFSSRPHGFNETDKQTLQELAARIAASKKEAEDGATGKGQQKSAVPAEDVHTTPALEAAATDRSEPSEEEEPRKHDFLTSVLVVLIVATALALGVLIGWKGAANRKAAAASLRAKAAASVPIVATATANSGPQPEQETEPAKAAPAVQDRTLPGAGAKTAAKGNRKTAAEPPSGGLIVTQNGKVIYRAEGATASSVPAGTESSLPGRQLVRRVEPDYPADARSRNIQGRVILDVQILGDGTVGNVGIAEGNPLLTEAAVRAVRQWKYQPYVVDGRPLQSQTRITISFALPPKP